MVYSGHSSIGTSSSSHVSAVWRQPESRTSWRDTRSFRTVGSGHNARIRRHVQRSATDVTQMRASVASPGSPSIRYSMIWSSSSVGRSRSGHGCGMCSVWFTPAATPDSSSCSSGMRKRRAGNGFKTHSGLFAVIEAWILRLGGHDSDRHHRVSRSRCAISYKCLCILCKFHYFKMHSTPLTRMCGRQLFHHH